MNDSGPKLGYAVHGLKLRYVSHLAHGYHFFVTLFSYSILPDNCNI
jgi:hypothetical protein